uniref:C2H2-type domain-containing protein n=1 Tax=Clastoptera arizonana TaxID=38151 RepID=A0A1B6EGT6_9HEMI
MAQKFTCISCRVAFTEAEIQRQHYKTDWHRYNLKRKVVDLPPVAAEEFQKRVLQQREKEEKEAKDTKTICKICKKSFNTTKAFENHINSKKHNAMLKSSLSETESVETKLTSSQTEPNENDERLIMSTNNDDYDTDTDTDTDMEVEEVDSDEWDEEYSENNPILRHNCLFCSHHSARMMKNLNHMTLAHSFFIPDIEFLIDMKGLLCYLGEKVCQGFICLWCNDRGKSFYSLESVQQHMIDKGHCKMFHEGEALLEYSSYYDYSSSYPDHEFTNVTDDEEVSVPILDDTDFQLALPSGATIGHRSLMRYYRQNFDPKKQAMPLQKKVHRIIAQYKALGWSGSDKQAIAKKARDINFMQRVQNKHRMKLGMKANILSVKRPQVNF